MVLEGLARNRKGLLDIAHFTCIQKSAAECGAAVTIDSLPTCADLVLSRETRITKPIDTIHLSGNVSAGDLLTNELSIGLSELKALMR